MSRSYLYYGNGECTIEGTNITGVQIECISKNLKIQKTTNNNLKTRLEKISNLVKEIKKLG